MLQSAGVPFEYRDYKKNPLSEEELRDLFARLGTEPSVLLRKNDRAYRELGLTGAEDAETMIRHMSEHPTLLQRPIGVRGQRAVVGRPPEKLMDLSG